MEQSTNTATKATPRGGKSRSGGGDGKRKKKGGLSPDSFYNAIKNLGSGPVEKVGAVQLNSIRDQNDSLLLSSLLVFFPGLLAGERARYRSG